MDDLIQVFCLTPASAEAQLHLKIFSPSDDLDGGSKSTCDLIGRDIGVVGMKLVDTVTVQSRMIV